MSASAEMRATELGEALGRLYALATRGGRRSLDAMRAACAAEGDPQDEFMSVHVAGTNGKGSVSASVEAVARESGLRTGLYTSPHLVRCSERICVDGVPVDDGRFASVLTHVLDRYPELTFFETITLVAFRVFRDASVDLAVIETGLGGRLDATNVMTRPKVTVITTIGIDHTAWLGETLESIALEKAGILRLDVPVVCGWLRPSERDRIEGYARSIGAGSLWSAGREFHAARVGASLQVDGPDGRSIQVAPGLSGAHQDNNAAVAIATVWRMSETLGQTGDSPLVSPRMFTDRAIAAGIAGVRWPGRLEQVASVRDDERDVGPCLLDGAHNDDGVHALAAAIDARPEPVNERALLFGAMDDKPWQSMVATLAPRFGARVYVAPSVRAAGRSAAAPSALAACDREGVVAASPIDGLRLARKRVGPNGLVVVAGSLYLVGELRAFLLDLPNDPQVGL